MAAHGLGSRFQPERVTLDAVEGKHEIDMPFAKESRQGDVTSLYAQNVPIKEAIPCDYGNSICLVFEYVDQESESLFSRHSWVITASFLVLAIVMCCLWPCRYGGPGPRESCACDAQARLRVELCRTGYDFGDLQIESK
jgi:hypothetical protein